MKKLLAFATMFIGVANLNSFAQSGEKCATDVNMREMAASNPAIQAAYEQYRQDVINTTKAYEAQIANTAQKTTASKVVVPIVFHVVLTQAQIDNDLGGVNEIYKRVQSQIAVLNRDYNAQNSDSTKIPAAFKPLFGNAQITFAIAHRKPDGKGTSGVEIKIAPVGFKGFQPQSGDMKNNSLGGLDPWDNKKYINVWIVNLVDGGGSQSNVLGFGYSPNYAAALWVPEQTGVVISYGAFGNRTSPNQYFIGGATGGRTLVHEMGHFFNLWHIWGNTQVGSGICGDDDDIADTPPQKDANQSCPSGAITNCTNSNGGEMYMNYMDYPGDDCVHMFTKGQVARMQAQFMNDSISHELTTHPDLTWWPTDIAETDKQVTDIYPNPSTGNFNISFTNAAGLQGIAITNMMGQQVKQVAVNNSNSYNFDLSGMPKGIYLVNCLFEEGTVTRKIVLQ